MKISTFKKRLAALTLIEVLMVIAVLMVLAAILLPALLRTQPQRSLRIQCVNNLKQISIATLVWAGDNNDKYPMFVPQTNGGSMEFTTGANVWKHFQVMSNELSTPRVLFCPAESDSQRFRATNFTWLWLNNSNLSFFMGIVSNDANPQLILSGDHNLTNGTAVKNGILELTPGRATGWTAEMHNTVGNIALADGSLQQVNSSADLQNVVVSSGAATNLIQMPVLGP